ncbi:hypothetical protein AAEP93_007651 [Penicillium crustosum]
MASKACRRYILSHDLEIISLLSRSIINSKSSVSGRELHHSQGRRVDKTERRCRDGLGFPGEFGYTPPDLEVYSSNRSPSDVDQEDSTETGSAGIIENLGVSLQFLA